MRHVNPAVGARTVWVQREFDAAMWYGAMTAAPTGPTVQRIFQLLYNAGVMFKSGLNWMCW